MSTREPGDAGPQRRSFTPIARLTGESERRLQALRRGLRRAGGFTLYFVLASGAARAEVLRRLRAWSGKDGTPEMRFLPEGDESARATLELLGRTDPALPLRGVVIPHAEALLDVDGGAAIAALNLARDILGGIIEGSLVLMLPEDRAGELPRAAPDLFDVRSGVFEIEAVPAPEGASHIALPELPTGPLRSPEELAATKAHLQTLTSAPDPPPAGALADAWLRLGRQLHSAARWEDALQAARQARRLAESIDYRSGVAEALLLEGRTSLLKDRLQDLGTTYNEALALYRSIEDRLGEANTLQSLGELFVRTDRLKDAEKAYSDALLIYKIIADRLGEANALKALGDLFVRIDRLKEAQNTYAEALHIFADIGNRLGEANTLEAIGDLFVRADRLKEAEEVYSYSLHTFTDLEERLGEARTLQALGNLFVRTDRFKEAEKVYSDALHLFREIENRIGEAITLQALGNLFVRTARLKEAEEVYSDALYIFREIEDRLDEANTLQSFGRLALASDEPAAAFGWFLQALFIHREVDPSLSVGSDHGWLARAAAWAGHPVRAVVLGGRALAVLNSVEDAFGQMIAAGDLADALIEMDERSAAEAALKLSWALAVSIGDPSADQRRALLTTLNPSFNPVVPPPESLLAEAHAQIQAAVARCEARLAEAGEDPYAPLETTSA